MGPQLGAQIALRLTYENNDFYYLSYGFDGWSGTLFGAKSDPTK